MIELGHDLLRIGVVIAAVVAIILALSGRRLARRALDQAHDALARLPPDASPYEPQLIESETRAFAGALATAIIACALALAIAVILTAIFGGARL